MTESSQHSKHSSIPALLFLINIALYGVFGVGIVISLLLAGSGVYSDWPFYLIVLVYGFLVTLMGPICTKFRRLAWGYVACFGGLSALYLWRLIEFRNMGVPYFAALAALLLVGIPLGRAVLIVASGKTGHEGEHV